MKMLMAVISRKPAEKVLDKLVNAGYMATFSETRGGMLRQSQLSVFLGVEDEAVPDVLRIIKENCKESQSIHQVQQDEDQNEVYPETGRFQLGSAVVFIWQLNEIHKY